MSAKKTTDRTILILAVVASLVAINIIGVKFFGRADLTRDGQYTLSEATRDTLRRLHDPVTVKAYFSKNMPPQFAANARYVQDLLEEYLSAGDGYFRYTFIDPMEEETSADKEKKKEVKRDIFGRAVRAPTSMESELQALGIPPVQVQSREADKMEVKRAYMGLAIKYGDNTEVIPVVKTTENLEYDLTTLMLKLTRDKTPKVVLATGPGGPTPQTDMGKIFGLLTQLYDVTHLDMSTQSTIADDVDALVVIGGKQPFAEDAKRAIDTFVTSGRSVAFLLDTMKSDLSTLQAEDVDHGLTDMIATYGVTLGKGLVLDTECATISVQRQQGFLRFAQPVRYPFMPISKGGDPSNPLTRGMGELAFPFMGEVTISLPDDSSKTETKVLASSSAGSWLMEPPYNLDPFQEFSLTGSGEQKARNLIVSLKGPIKSHYASDAATTQDVTNGRILVAGGSTFMTDQFAQPSNQALVLNMIDWLVLDEALSAMRARGLSGAPVDADLSDATRSTVKYGNILGLPLLFIVMGLFRWRRREQRRAHATF